MQQLLLGIHSQHGRARRDQRPARGSSQAAPRAGDGARWRYCTTGSRVSSRTAAAAASLFAGKADEQPRRVRDVLNAVAPAGGVRDLDEMYHDAKADLVDAGRRAAGWLRRFVETPLALALALAHALTLRPATAQLALCLANVGVLGQRAARRGRSPARPRPSTSRARPRATRRRGRVDGLGAALAPRTRTRRRARRRSLLVEAAAERRRKAAG